MTPPGTAAWRAAMTAIARAFVPPVASWHSQKGTPVTTTLDPDALTGPLADIADELTAAGYSVHDPGCLKIINARGALADLTITESGLLTWEYRSREGSPIDPDQLTGIVTAILGQ